MTPPSAAPAGMCDFHHAHLFAADLDAALQFYRRWFGAEIAWDGTFAGVRNVFVRLGTGRLHFYDQAPRAHGRSAVHHLGIRVRGLESLVARMRDAKVGLRSEIRRHPEGSYLMVEGPDGVLLELFEPDPAGLPEAVCSTSRTDRDLDARRASLAGQNAAPRVRGPRLRAGSVHDLEILQAGPH